MPKARLISEVFGLDDAVGPNALELYIARLRKKLGAGGLRIRTVRGLGYMLEKGLMRPARRSLKRAVLLNLLAPVLLLAVAIGAGGYLTITSVVESSHDRLLDGSLMAIAERLAVESGEVVVDMPQVALGMLETKTQDNVYYLVTSDAGPVTGYPDLPLGRMAAALPGQPGPLERHVSRQCRAPRRGGAPRLWRRASGDRRRRRDPARPQPAAQRDAAQPGSGGGRPDTGHRGSGVGFRRARVDATRRPQPADRHPRRHRLARSAAARSVRGAAGGDGPRHRHQRHVRAPALGHRAAAALHCRRLPPDAHAAGHRQDACGPAAAGKCGSRS